MDQDYKPSEETQPIEISTPVNTSSQVIDVVRSDSMQQPEVTQATDEPEPLLEAENPTEEMPKTDVIAPEQETIAKKSKPSKKGILKTLLFVLLVALLVGAGIAATLWRDQVASDLEKQQAANIASLVKTINALQLKLAADDNATADQTSDTSVAPSAAVIESIEAALTSGNTAALEGYMAASVNVAHEASEAVVSTPTEATTSVMNAIAAATSPWNFELSASVLSSYGSSDYGQYFPSNAVVGKSANNKIVSFSFNSNAKISTIFLVSDESLLE